MTVIITQLMSASVPMDMLDAVTREMDVEHTPPTGMIVHTHYEQDGRVHIMDVWESSQAHQEFVETRLRPAMGRVAAARGFDLVAAGTPETVITDVHHVVRGAPALAGAV